MSGAMNVRQKLAKGRPLEGHSNVGPTVTITLAQTNPVVNVPTGPYQATATDAEQGDISSRIVWKISIGKGVFQTLGTGGSTSLTFDTVGSETLYASVTDSFGATDTDSVVVTVVSAGSP